jgi:putative phosphoesterase
MTTRIGVVADTHCPGFLERLPSALFDALRGVDLILHAGDVDAQQTLDELARIAPVQAVRGDHDRGLGALPETRRLEVEGKRIVVVHGNRSRWFEEPQTLIWTLSLGYLHPRFGLSRALRRRFPDADVIVFGHTHRPAVERYGDVLVFNPGGVHQWNPSTAAERLRHHPGWFEWCWLQVARNLRSYPGPSAGILEVSQSGVVPKIVNL